jgi:hypothetical protein
MTDAFGEPIEIGCYLGTVDQEGDAWKGIVDKIGKRTVRIYVTDTNSKRPFTQVGDTKWVHPHRSIRTKESFS